jgi:hypothetical protein
MRLVSGTIKLLFIASICLVAFIALSKGLKVSEAQLSHLNGIKTLGTLGTLDVFTQRGGEGPNVNSDAFYLGETVWLYAKATDNYGWPIQQLAVTFYASNNYGQAFDLYGTTNSSGIAETHFGLPYPDPDHWAGNWTVVASANNLASDTVAFSVYAPSLVTVPFIPYGTIGALIACFAGCELFVRLKGR